MNSKTLQTVLIITSSYPAGKHDLQGIFIKKQVDSMAKRGYRMVVITPYIPGSLFHETDNNITIYRFPYFFPLHLHRLCCSGGLYFGFKNSFLGKVQAVPYLISMILFSGIIIRKEKISLIHTHWIIPQGIAGAFWGIITGIPHITTSHVLDVTITNNMPIFKGLMRWILMHTEKATVNSSFTKKQVIQFAPPSLSIQIIPMGMDETRISGSNHKMAPECKDYQVLFVGRIIKWKGIDILLQAIYQVRLKIPEIKLKIIGEGPDTNYFMDIVHKLSLENTVTFCGRVSDPELNHAYQTSDLFILPSRPHRDIIMEGLGVVLLEAMASGVPVIGSNTGGIPDIITDGVNGILVPPGDADALADAIIRIYGNPEIADAFRKEGLKTVKKRFSWDSIAHQFHEVYQQVLNGKG